MAVLLCCGCRVWMTDLCGPTMIKFWYPLLKAWWSRDMHGPLLYCGEGGHAAAGPTLPPPASPLAGLRLWYTGLPLPYPYSSPAGAARLGAAHAQHPYSEHSSRGPSHPLLGWWLGPSYPYSCEGRGLGPPHPSCPSSWACAWGLPATSAAPTLEARGRGHAQLTSRRWARII